MSTRAFTGLVLCALTALVGAAILDAPGEDSFPIAAPVETSTAPAPAQADEILPAAPSDAPTPLCPNETWGTWAWGSNDVFQLGDGTSTPRYLPNPVSLLCTGVIAVASRGKCSVALKDDGSVWAWGDNQSGQIGDGTTVYRSEPVRTLVVSQIIAVAAGGHHNLALRSDGTVWAWGFNTFGQLGDGTTVSRSTPVQVRRLTGIVAIGAGWHHSLALDVDGRVWAWGLNRDGQLGDGSTTDSPLPVQAVDLNEVVAISGGEFHSMAVRSDGSVRTWGDNYWGQIGDGTRTDRWTPVQPVGLSSGFVAVHGSDHSMALRGDATVWGWGFNHYGQIGDGTTVTMRLTPVQTVNLTSVIKIIAGAFHSLALHDDGAISSWGWNLNGALGTGDTYDRIVPGPVVGLGGVRDIAAGDGYSLATK